MIVLLRDLHTATNHYCKHEVFNSRYRVTAPNNEYSSDSVFTFSVHGNMHKDRTRKPHHEPQRSEILPKDWTRETRTLCVSY
jgi:hypothetical protein